MIYYYRFMKMFLLIIVMLPAFLHAQVTPDKGGNSPSSMHFEEGNQPTVSSFFAEFRENYPLSNDNKMVVLASSSDKAGTHHRYDQYYKGVQVIGAQYVLHENNGSVWFANGRLVHGLDLNVNPAISEQAALSSALQEVGAEVYMWDKVGNEAFLKKEQHDPHATFEPKGELMLTSGTEALASENIRLVYRFDIYAEQPLGRYWVDVDAKTGEIVNKTSRIHTGDVPGSGNSLYDGNVNMTVDEVSASSFRLREATTRGAAINTYNMNNGTNYGAATDFTSTTADGPWDGVGVNGHWGAEATYDYYFNEHGRNSLDDAGFALNSYVHYSSNYNNAFWDGSRMTYGDGDGSTFTPLVGLDVVGHELTHGVTNFSSNLIYSGESGGLNESFSDIFGNLVEFEMQGPPPGGGSWRIGEQITPDGLGIRNMENPNEFNNPDTYLGDYWYDEVHNTSGVQNFWFYLLTEGGSGTNDNGDAYSVTGIGLADAAAIAFHNNTSYLFPSATYYDARLGAIACAISLFGSNSQQVSSVMDAWDAVGVYGIIPLNDLCADAIAIGFGTTSGTTIEATTDAGAPDCGDANITSPGVWYTIDGNGYNITASICGGADWDTKMSVFTGSCGALVCVDGNDDFCALQSEVSWASTLGSTYHILVHGFDGQTGNFDLSVTTDETPMISVSHSSLSFAVPVDGTDSKLITISNGASTMDLTWYVTKAEPIPLSSMEGNGTGENQDVTPVSTIRKAPVNEYYIGEQTIESLKENNILDGYEIQDQLVGIKDIVFTDKMEFYNTLTEAVGEQNSHLLPAIMQQAVIRQDGIIANTIVPKDLGETAFDQAEAAQASYKVTVRLDPDFIPIPLTLSPGILYDNGPIMNSPGTGVGGTDESVLQNVSLGHNWFGLGHQRSANNKVADEFTVIDPAGWQVDELVFYAYQSFAGNTSTITGVYYEIWDGEPGNPGSTIVYGDMVTNRLVNSTWTNMYRVTELTSGSNTDRAIMENVAIANVLLAPGTYWVVWQTDGSASSGPWVPPITINGQTTTGNAQQSINGGSWNALVDAGYPQGLPFVVRGSLAACPWLSYTPYSGTTGPGSSDDVTVSVDAAGLSPGTYNCDLKILSNDPNNSELIIPVTMVVGGDCPITPATLPYAEGFETMNGIAIGDGSICGPTFYWSFDTDHPGQGRASYGTYAYMTASGNGALTMDRSPSGDNTINYAILTIDLSDYTAANDLELSFSYADHGDESSANDKVWIRGSTVDAWIEVTDLDPGSMTDDVFQNVASIDIDNILANASPPQTVSALTQVRFGQEGTDPYPSGSSPSPSDGITFDDIVIQQLSLPCAIPPITLPYHEGFELISGTSQNSGVSCFAEFIWEYQTTAEGEGRLQYGTNAHQVNTGIGAATLDRIYNNNAYSTNYLILTLNMSDYSSSTDLELSFSYAHHIDESHPDDKVWVRGSVNDSWVEIYDLDPNSIASNVYMDVTGLDIDDVLANASPPQTVSSSFQLRFGQHDNLPVPDDGISFDDISVTEFAPFKDAAFDGDEDSNMQIYAHNQTISIRSLGEMAEAEKEVWVYDIMGRTVLQTKLMPSALDQLKVSAQGYLIVKVLSGNTVTTEKVMVR